MTKLTKYAGALVLTGGLLLGGTSWVSTESANAQTAVPKERHPHIRRAIEELREARKELKEGAHDFGGHRVEAIEAVDAAIKQLKIALKYDKN